MDRDLSRGAVTGLGPARLYGRDAAVALVGEFLERPLTDGVPRSQPVPVLVFVGGRGTGKTALLAEVARQIDQQAPLATVRCRTTGLRTTQEILSALAFELNAQSGRYGSLPFPRLVVGNLVIAETLDTTNRAAARDQVVAVLERYRNVDALRDFLATVAPDVLSLVGVPGAQAGGHYLPDLLLRGLTSGRLGRRVVLGEGQDWYGHQDLGTRSNPLDRLIKLNLDARSADEAVRRQADQVLWAAFLADLRSAFRTGRRHDEWSWNCAVLVDDVDTPVGLDLLEGLVTARRLQATNPRIEPDPLTVVATTQAPLSPDEDEPPVAERASLADHLRRGGDHLERGGPDEQRHWWYPVGLRDLTADEVLAMVTALELRGVADSHVAGAVHRFTGGHPGTTDLLLQAVSQRPADAADLAAVLRGPAPSVVGQAKTTTEQSLLDSVVRGLPAAVLDDLVTCSAARDADEASRLQSAGLLVAPPGQRPQLFSTRWWPPAGGSVPGERGGAVQPGRMRPVLRLLLLRRLAARGGGPATWGETHARLRRDCREAGDEVGAMYHALAMDEVELVCRWLAEQLPTTAVDAWLGRLEAVLEAPSRLDLHLDPVDRVSELTRWASVDEVPLEPVARVVVGEWIFAHPLLSGDQEALHLELADAYDAVAPHSYDGRSVLRRRAQKHRAAASGRPY